MNANQNRSTSESPGASGHLNILLVSTSYPADERDWRGVFMRHMVNALSTRDDLRVSIWAPPGPRPPSVHETTSRREREMLRQLMSAGGIAHLLRRERARGILAAIRLLSGLRRVFVAEPVDVYHVNWLQCALPLPRNDTPLLVTVLGNDMRLLRLPGMRFLLSRTMRGRRVTICPNADWMVETLREKFGKLAQVQAVSFGIDPRWFALERAAHETHDWLVVSRLTAKKLGPLFAWCEKLFRDHPERRLHLIGPMQEQIDIPAWACYHGSASADDLRERWFPHAAGLITLSEHDEGRPQVLLEAMAAGLPLIASPLPAHTDLIDDGVEGLIVDDRDAFAVALAALEDPIENVRMGSAGRMRVQREMGTWADCAERYASTYRELVREVPGG